ncbi:MAG TPA: hypothetical protein VN436_15960 [Holophaga sp.]|nr:hypothetical protein [Holophaga sp.]
MNPLLWTNLRIAHCLGRTYLAMPWLGPSALGLGFLGTRSGLQARNQKARSRGWWMIPLVAWLPLVYWILAQLIRQY